MAKAYSTTIFVFAGVFAILLGLSPKFGAVISTIPLHSWVVHPLSFGLITVAGAKISVDNKIDFTKNSTLMKFGAVYSNYGNWR